MPGGVYLRTEAHNKRIGESVRKAWKENPEYRRRHSLALRKVDWPSREGENNPFYGKTHSRRFRRRSSLLRKREARDGTGACSPEARAKQGKSFKRWINETPEGREVKKASGVRLARMNRLVVRKGPDHWNWQGGKSYLNRGLFRYGRDYRMGRRLALRRDGYRCRALGCKASYANGGKIETHHIVPREWDGSNRPSNLLSLCHFHHVRVWTVPFEIRPVRGCVLRFPRLQEKRYA